MINIPEIEERRKKLYPVLRQARKYRQKVKLAYFILTVKYALPLDPHQVPRQPEIHHPLDEHAGENSA
jgi:hypothetical protein